RALSPARSRLAALVRPAELRDLPHAHVLRLRRRRSGALERHRHRLGLHLVSAGDRRVVAARIDRRALVLAAVRTPAARCAHGARAGFAGSGCGSRGRVNLAPAFRVDRAMTEHGILEQWWVTVLGDVLIWARMRVLESGVAEVFSAEGETLRYDDEDAA